jgi:type I restriction enzyme M protein
MSPYERFEVSRYTYEYLIAEFADSASKKGGEFYTPRSVVSMMVRLLKPTLKHNIYDPCCGFASLENTALFHGDAHSSATCKLVNN